MKTVSKLLSCVLAGTLLFGCSSKPAEEPVEEEKVAVIGQESETAVFFDIVNGTGKDIKSVTVKTSSMEKYPENMMTESVFTADETCTMYYELSADVKDEATDKVVSEEYTVQITFADDSTAELHAFPFEDIKEACIIKLDGEIAYIEYTSLNNEKVSTLEAEKAIIKQKEDQAKKEQEAAAPVEEAPVYEEPVYEEVYYEETYYEEPAYDAGGGANTDGCLGGALID